ncbi:hypothetical protein J8J14_15280 [Roseomonas sp. SSH11]|uniref:DUF2939 domain-containing protein n=1 Tax=Pararoseomonas baculiformis TaxID=2820812 RepID=A0ABS4AGI1_9PROT|nr:hypothetical protein [Pararoseomonas baculiformis]MBP0446136.1 hypothetical protein [Pararoseomonas baculiformis]
MGDASRADVWDEVWAEYDARQARRHPRPAPRRARRASTPELNGWTGQAPSWRRVRPMRQVIPALLAGLVLILGWLAIPWLLALRISVPIGQNDAPALIRQFDQASTQASLRAAMAAQVPDGGGEGARRFLSGMAERMADSWARPEGVAAWLAVRSQAGRGDGPAMLSRLRSARPLGLSAFSLEYGPAEGAGGVAFELAWQGDGFRVTGLRFLDERPAPLRAPASPVLAMR